MKIELFEQKQHACSLRISLWYMPDNAETQRKIYTALLGDPDLKNTGTLFLEKKKVYDDCSPPFRRLLKTMGSIQDIDLFPNSWIRIDLSNTELVLAVKTDNVAPICLLREEEFNKK